MLVVRRCNGKVSTGIEGLVADKHAVTEGFPGQVFGRCKTTVTKEMAFTVHDVSIAVKYGWGRFCYSRSDTADSIRCGEEVAGIEETDVVSIKGAQAFVHRIVDAFVWFRHQLDAVTIA